MTAGLYEWSVWKDGAGEVSGCERSKRAAMDKAEEVERQIGPRGTVTKVTGPRGARWFHTPRENRGGMKWETRA